MLRRMALVWRLFSFTELFSQCLRIIHGKLNDIIRGVLCIVPALDPVCIRTCLDSRKDLFLVFVRIADHQDERALPDRDMVDDSQYDRNKCACKECHQIQLASACDADMNGPHQIKHINGILDGSTEAEDRQSADRSEDHDSIGLQGKDDR